MYSTGSKPFIIGVTDEGIFRLYDKTLLKTIIIMTAWHTQYYQQDATYEGQ